MEDWVEPMAKAWGKYCGSAGITDFSFSFASMGPDDSVTVGGTSVDGVSVTQEYHLVEEDELALQWMRSVAEDGSSTTTWFGGSAIAEAMAGPLASGIPFATWGEFFASQSIDVANATSYTVQSANEIAAIVWHLNGSRTEVRIPRPDPFGEVVVWEQTEYSPTGEVVSHSYGTTLRATGQPVIVTWERDVDANGEPTGNWQQSVEAYNPNQPEPDDLSAAQIGEIFGAQLGSLIAGSNPFAQVLAGSALATLLGNIGGAISWFNSDNDAGDGPASLTDDLGDVQVPEFSNFFTVLKGQASGALSSFLAAELGEALGVEGFGGQLFTTVASRTIGHVLSTVVNNLSTGAEIFKDLGNGLLTNLEYGIGSLIGGYLARQIIDIDTQAGAIGASLGSALGTFVGTSIASGFTSALAGVTAGTEGLLAGIGASFAAELGITGIGATAAGVGFGELFGALGNLIIPGIGAFIGVIVGALLGSLFQKKTVPQAAGEVELNFDEGQFYLDNVFARKGGNEDLAREMSEASRDILNGYLDMIGGDNANMISPTQIYGHSSGQLWVKVDTDGDGDLDKVNVESAGEAVAST